MRYPNEGDLVPMSAAEASTFVRSMIHDEATGPGDYERAMERLEARYGLGFWQLDHLRKRKAKTCNTDLYVRIKLAFIDHCQRKAKILLERAAIAQAVGASNDDNIRDIADQIRALAARLEAAKGG